MSIAPRSMFGYVDKHCLVYCGPERCDCKRGHLELSDYISDRVFDGCRPITAKRLQLIRDAYIRQIIRAKLIPTGSD